MSYCHVGECSESWDQVWSHDEKEEQEQSEIDSSENEYEGTDSSPLYDSDEEIDMGTRIVTALTCAFVVGPSIYSLMV